MMMFATGDFHGDPSRLGTNIFPEQREMTKEDYVIVLGDFGLVWNCGSESREERYWLNWLEKKPFTTLFVDGNHENFDRLDASPVEEWHGGLVHRLRPSVIHLMRGQVFDIDGQTFFSFGGARSHDIRDGILDPELDKATIKRWKKDYSKVFRINRVSWWEQEMPSEEEMETGRANLAKASNKVDFILTHCAPASTCAIMSQGTFETDRLTRYLEEIKQSTEYGNWLFGHYHINRVVDVRDICLYEQIVQIL